MLAFYSLRLVLDLMLGPVYYQLMSYENIIKNEFLWYFGLYLAIALVLKLSTGEKIVKVTKAVFVFWAVLLLVPVIDFFFSGGQGYFLTYVTPQNFWQEFFSLFGYLGSRHFSYGQTITSMAGFFLIIAYTFKKTSSLVRTTLACALCYLVGYFYAAPPVFFPYGLTLPFFGLVALEGTAWLAFFDFKKLKELGGNLHLLRSAHYTGLLLFGNIVYFLHFPAGIEWQSLLLAAFSCFFAFQGALVINNLYDKKEISLNRKTYWSLGLLFLLLALYSGLLVNAAFFLVTLAAILISVSYSANPIRFKRFGYWNNLIIGLESSLAFAAGFLSQTPQIRLVPLNFFLAILITFSIAANIKDLKDSKQDGKTGIKTIPAMLGKKRALIWLALLTSICFPLPIVILALWPLLPASLAFGLANGLALLKFKTEKTVFAAYLLFLLFAAAWLLFFQGYSYL